jgi:hypothetical protein
MAKLSSQKEIENYTNLSLETCKTEGYPMAKIAGRWQSHTDLIDDFIKRRVIEEMEKKNPVNTL